MITHTVDVHAHIFDALESGKLSFLTMKAHSFAQSGDKVVIRKLSSFGGVETEVGSRSTPICITFKLGFFVSGGTFGIEVGTNAFQLLVWEN